jgi:hypothetical protein
MEGDYFGFNVGKLLVGLMRLLRRKGLIEEDELLDMLWEAKEPYFPWSRQEIKELLKL